MYETNLKRAGFSEITVRYPKLEDFSAEQIQQIEQEYHYKSWLNEKTQVPFILYQAIKKQIFRGTKKDQSICFGLFIILFLVLKLN